MPPLSLIVHFAAGVIGALLIFLVAVRLRGESFSAPFGVILIGLLCAALSQYLSPWATPLVLALYGVATWREGR